MVHWLEPKCLEAQNPHPITFPRLSYCSVNWRGSICALIKFHEVISKSCFVEVRHHLLCGDAAANVTPELVPFRACCEA